jgi:hypothetical protein
MELAFHFQLAIQETEYALEGDLVPGFGHETAGIPDDPHLDGITADATHTWGHANSPSFL